MAHCRCQIGRTNSQQLLPGIEGISVLCRECPSGRYAFYVGQQQATSGQRNYSLDITQFESRSRQARQSGRNFSCRRNASAGKPSAVEATMASATITSATGLPGSGAEYEQADRDDTNDKNEVLHLTKLPGQQESPLEKIVPPARHAKKAWQLGHRDRQAGAGLESHENAVAD